MDRALAADEAVAKIAAAIGEPARARILYNLMDGRSRTSTELSAVADIAPSTASAHLGRLLASHLVVVQAQSRHRYYKIASAEVAAVLEGLMVVAGVSPAPFAPTTPLELRGARTCYDHMAGVVAVSLLEKLQSTGCIRPAEQRDYELTRIGEKALVDLGIDAELLRKQHRRFACACIDWSERKAHLGGSLGAALLDTMLRRRWLARELDSRGLTVTALGARELASRFSIVAEIHES